MTARMRVGIVVCLFSVTAGAALVARITAEDQPASQPAKPAAKEPPSDVDAKDWDAIRKSAETYVAAYNAGDAKAIADLYTDNAELVTATGTVYRGRKVIAEEYAAFFKEHPDATMKVVVDSVRFVSPTLAVEDGTTETHLGKDQPAVFSRYVAMHMKHEGRWHLASVRDHDLESKDKPDDLEELTWLIGRWVDEAPESLMELDCYWHPSGAYLMRDFDIKVEGLLASSGTERIGWDPLKKQIRSWLFDADGGYLEGLWVRQDQEWIVTAQGFRADGEPIHATYVMSPLRKDAYHITSINRTAGRQKLKDFEMTVVRRPPAPGKPPALKRPSSKKPDLKNKK